MSNKIKNDDKTQIIVDKSLAQSGALAVQDAANNMRDMNTLLSTASGVTLANFIESGDVKYLKALDDLNKQAKTSTNHFIDLYTNVAHPNK
jgi:hypothetical protein